LAAGFAAGLAAAAVVLAAAGFLAASFFGAAFLAGAAFVAGAFFAVALAGAFLDVAIDNPPFQSAVAGRGNFCEQWIHASM
jgi:hypothetical protein